MTQLTGVGIVLLAACGRGSSQSDPAVLTLGSGAVIEATTERAISSRTDKAGGAFTASVSSAVKDGEGLVVIPAGSTLHLTITELQPANGKRAADGKISVVLTAVTVGGKPFPVSGDVTAMAHVIGAVVGGAAGAAFAVETANRDVVVSAGTPITVTLRGPVTVSFR
jgi:hypothetical protein